MVGIPSRPVATSWQKSTASGSGACVEVARTREYVWIRDSKEPRRRAFGTRREQWEMFLAGVRRGEFDAST